MPRGEVVGGELVARFDDGTRTLGAGHSAEWIADRPHTYSAGSAEDVQAAVLMRYPIARPGETSSSRDGPTMPTVAATAKAS
jgi:hypothetical protein